MGLNKDFLISVLFQISLKCKAIRKLPESNDEYIYRVDHCRSISQY